jgi:outer membrane protein TolC
MKRFSLLIFAAFMMLAAPSVQATEQGEATPDSTHPAGTETVELDIDGQFDLMRCVKRGLAENPTIKSARFQLFSKDYARKSSRGEFGPKLSAGYGFTHYDEQPSKEGQILGSQDQWKFTVNLSQPIFTGFRLLSNYQKAELSAEQAKAQIQQAELSLVQTIQTNYFLLLKGRMDVKSAKDSVARLESQLKVTKAFYDVGLKPRLDVLEAEVDLAKAQQDLLLAQNEVDTQIARLNTLLGIPLNHKTHYVGKLVYEPFGKPLNDCLDSAYRYRPDLEIGRKSVEIARKDVKISASDFYPQVSADWDYSQAGDDPSVQGDTHSARYSEWSVGANVKWNVFEWGKTYYGYRSAKEGVAKVEAELANTRLEASYEVKSSFLKLNEASDRIGVARKSVESAKEGYRMAVARYQAQVGTNTEVLDAQARLTSAEANLSTALADYQTALSKLYVAMGEKNIALDNS